MKKTQRGAYSILVALTIPIIFGIGLILLCMARVQIIHSHMGNAAQLAALAGVKYYADKAPERKVTKTDINNIAKHTVEFNHQKETFKCHAGNFVIEDVSTGHCDDNFCNSGFDKIDSVPDPKINAVRVTLSTDVACKTFSKTLRVVRYGVKGYCGDEFEDALRGEECDNGANNGIACVPTPGYNRACGSTTSCAWCDTSCKDMNESVNNRCCGDGGGANHPSEQCDDGNTDDSDGCKNDCCLPFFEWDGKECVDTRCQADGIQPAQGEECDPINPFCQSDCTCQAGFVAGPNFTCVNNSECETNPVACVCGPTDTEYTATIALNIAGNEPNGRWAQRTVDQAFILGQLNSQGIPVTDVKRNYIKHLSFRPTRINGSNIARDIKVPITDHGRNTSSYWDFFSNENNRGAFSIGNNISDYLNMRTSATQCNPAYIRNRLNSAGFGFDNHSENMTARSNFTNTTGDGNLTGIDFWSCSPDDSGDVGFTGMAVNINMKLCVPQSGICLNPIPNTLSCGGAAPASDTSFDLVPSCSGGFCQAVCNNALGYRYYNDTCVSCTNRIRDGDETDIDCGGATCPPCALPLEVTCSPTPASTTVGNSISWGASVSNGTAPDYTYTWTINGSGKAPVTIASNTHSVLDGPYGAAGTISASIIVVNGGRTATANCGDATIISNPPDPAPTVDLQTSTPNISCGQPATLSWTSTYADWCWSFNNPQDSVWSDKIQPTANPNYTTVNLSTNSTYSIWCHGPGGDAIDSVTINVGACTACGDGNVDAGENCDDGNISDDGNGCSATCTFSTKTFICNAKPINTSWNTVDQYPQTCTAWNAAGKTCQTWNPPDDPITEINPVGSNESCRASNLCGNGNLDAGENCDDNNITDDGNGCSAACTFSTRLFNCPPKPADSSWNTVPSYTQSCTEWNAGTKTCQTWNPPDDNTTEENMTPSLTECRYIRNVTGAFINAPTSPECGGKVNLSWGASNATHFSIWRSSPGAPAFTHRGLLMSGGWILINDHTTSNSMVYTTPNPGETYNYAVWATNRSTYDAVTTAFGTNSGTSSAPCASCGDGTRNGTESCDDGNTSDDGNGCSGSCTLSTRWYNCQPKPADGAWNTVFRYQQTCTAWNDGGKTCQTWTPADDPITEENAAPSATSCRYIPLCGNGNLDAGEDCDDGNRTDSGNGCNATCKYSTRIFNCAPKPADPKAIWNTVDKYTQTCYAWDAPSRTCDKWTPSDSTTVQNATPSTTSCRYTMLGCVTDADCTNGNVCDGAERCVSGSCQTGTPLSCPANNLCDIPGCNPTTGCTHTPRTCADDANPCTDAQCNLGNGACEQVNDNSNTCSDNNACTQTDACLNGICRGSNPVVCNDPNTNDCTFPSCNSATGACTTTSTHPDGTGCDDGLYCSQDDVCEKGVCIEERRRSCRDANVCTSDSCNEGADRCEFSSIIGCCTSDADCNNGSYCDGTESCVNNRCQPGAAPCANDGQFCNGTESCNEATDSCTSTPAPCANDGQFCNGTESCNESTDSCTTTPAPCPNDGQFCNGTESCNESTDSCNTPVQPCRNDGLFCNGTESCNESTDSCNTPVAPCANDGQYCNGAESCNESTDSCNTPVQPCRDDGQYCNGAESCNESTDSCNTPVTPCPNDGDACNGTETCNESTDQCSAVGVPNCDDGDACTDDFCSGGACQNPDNGTCSCRTNSDCDDGDACTGSETCSGGSCQPGTPVQCDDGDACNGYEYCDAGACQPGSPMECDDGDACNGTEYCSGGSCQAGTPSSDPDCGGDDGGGGGGGECEWPKPVKVAVIDGAPICCGIGGWGTCFKCGDKCRDNCLSKAVYDENTEDGCGTTVIDCIPGGPAAPYNPEEGCDDETGCCGPHDPMSGPDCENFVPTPGACNPIVPAWCVLDPDCDPSTFPPPICCRLLLE